MPMCHAVGRLLLMVPWEPAMLPCAPLQRPAAGGATMTRGWSCRTKSRLATQASMCALTSVVPLAHVNGLASKYPTNTVSSGAQAAATARTSKVDTTSTTSPMWARRSQLGLPVSPHVTVGLQCQAQHNALQAPISQLQCAYLLVISRAQRMGVWVIALRHWHMGRNVRRHAMPDMFSWVDQPSAALAT